MSEYATEVDHYITTAEGVRQEMLSSIRALVHTLAPGVQECISWRMPPFRLPEGGNILQMAAFKAHIGLYPEPEAIEAFKTELSGYRTSKGAIQFPLDHELPLALIERIIRYRLAQLRARG